MLVILGLLGMAMLGSAFLPSSDDEGVEQAAEEVDTDPVEEGDLDGSQIDLFLDGQDGHFVDQTDTLVGGEGDDYIRGGAHDILFGGAGSDSFEAPTVGPVYIQDFEDEDTIIIPYTGSEPEIAFADMDHGTMIFADGVPIVEVRGAYEFADKIRLVANDQHV